jgi:multidrug efflux pump subunit AcrA (membrane-fusion protein)
MVSQSIQGILSEMEKTIAALGRYEGTIPFAGEEGKAFDALLNRLRASRESVDGETAAWRAAAKARKDDEKTAARLYAAVRLQLEAHYDAADAPELDEFLHTSPNVTDTADEWLEDLEKMSRGLTAHQEELGFAAARLPELGEVMTALRAAIGETASREAAKRTAVAKWEAAKADYKTARSSLRRKLQAHFGNRRDARLEEFFD